MKIDAHQHYWNPARGDYDWMDDGNPTLFRPYLPTDLAPFLDVAGIDGTVLVQAAASVEETEYMLGLADATPSVKGVVGWIDFEKSEHISQLERLSEHPKFLGVRPMIQDIEDIDWMLRRDVQWAYEAVVKLDLTFDALGFPEHLPNFLILIKRYPEMRTVLDHAMKPLIAKNMEDGDSFQEWADHMSELAGKTKAYVKLSGLVTEAKSGWSINDLKPFSDHILNAFGPARVMWGSDWPVCRLQSEYDEWLDTAKALTAHLSDADQARVFGETAAEFYRLS